MRGCLQFLPWLLMWHAGVALAQPPPIDDPYAHRLRTAVFPVFFQAGVSQTHIGSAVRAEVDVVRGFGVQLDARLPWANLAGQTDPRGLSLQAGVLWHFEDRTEIERLSGTVYPEDAPAVGGRSVPTDRDLDVPVSQKLGGPRLTLPEKDRTLEAPMRSVQTIRAGYSYRRAVQRARPALLEGGERHADNTLHVLHAGYGWGEHWNLAKENAGGERELGWRRFYLDVLLSLEPWVDAELLEGPPDEPTEMFSVGARMGMEGAIDALIEEAENLGFGYLLELGVLPGKSGLEGYLFIGLGLELDG